MLVMVQGTSTASHVPQNRPLSRSGSLTRPCSISQQGRAQPGSPRHSWQASPAFLLSQCSGAPSWSGASPTGTAGWRGKLQHEWAKLRGKRSACYCVLFCCCSMLTCRSRTAVTLCRGVSCANPPFLVDYCSWLYDLQQNTDSNVAALPNWTGTETLFLSNGPSQAMMSLTCKVALGSTQLRICETEGIWKCFLNRLHSC